MLSYVTRGPTFTFLTILKNYGQVDTPHQGVDIDYVLFPIIAHCQIQMTIAVHIAKGYTVYAG